MDLQANISTRRFKRRSRAAVASGFRGRASAHKLGMSIIPFYNFSLQLQLLSHLHLRLQLRLPPSTWITIFLQFIPIDFLKKLCDNFYREGRISSSRNEKGATHEQKPVNSFYGSNCQEFRGGG